VTFMDDRTFLHMLDSLADAEIAVEVDSRTHSALATFSVDGHIRATMSVWLDELVIEGFILNGQDHGIELVIRNVSVLDREPGLARIVEAVCRAGGLTLSS
jgi:hypothetical protein